MQKNRFYAALLFFILFFGRYDASSATAASREIISQMRQMRFPSYQMRSSPSLPALSDTVSRLFSPRSTSMRSPLSSAAYPSNANKGKAICESVLACTSALMFVPTFSYVCISISPNV